MRRPVLRSILTRQYRFATLGLAKTLHTARQAIDLTGGLAAEVAERLGLHNGHDEPGVVNGEVVPEPEPVASPPPPPPAATSAPAPPAPAPEPAHVSREAELVEAFSEPGAEDGAGAQVRVSEPWPNYRHLKARDVIARMPSATPEELAAVELFELAGANRKSVVDAAQQALKKASPPR
jgi:hypothetical protein